MRGVSRGHSRKNTVQLALILSASFLVVVRSQAQAARNGIDCLIEVSAAQRGGNRKNRECQPIAERDGDIVPDFIPPLW